MSILFSVSYTHLPMISEVNVTGNKATLILSGEADGAAGYDYVISTDRDCITNKDYASVNKNQDVYKRQVSI